MDGQSHSCGQQYAPHPPQRKPLTDYINAAGINGADSPHMVVEKLQSAIERAHGIVDRNN